MAILVSDAKTELEYLKKDLSDVSTNVFLSWCRNIERYVYEVLCETDPERFVSEQTYNVVNGTQSLPSDFQHIRPDSCGFFEVVDSTNTTTKLPVTRYGSIQPGFYVTSNNSVVFTGFENAKTYVLRYIPLLTDIDALTDYFTVNTATGGKEVIPPRFMEYVVKALDVQYTQWDEDAGAESLSDFRYTRVLDEMLDRMKRTPQVYSLDDYSIYY